MISLYCLFLCLPDKDKVGTPMLRYFVHSRQRLAMKILTLLFLLLLALQSFTDLGILDDPLPDIPIKCFLPPCLYFDYLYIS
jgi:hypothetical protein